MENYSSCFIAVHPLWKSNRKKEFSETFQKYLSNSSNPYKCSLVCIKLCPDLFKSKNNGMAVSIAIELQSFLDRHEGQYTGCLTEDLQNDVVHITFKQKNTGLKRLLVKLYRLHDIREQILPKLQCLIQEGQYKDVCIVAAVLKLQEYFSTEELIVPLFCLDQLSLADEFLESSPRHQKELVLFIDQVIGQRPETLRILEKFNITNVNMFKPRKILCNTVAKLLKRYKLDMSLCPNLQRRRAEGGLRYLFYKYYIEKGLQTSAFHSLIEDAVRETPNLSIKLMDLFCEYGDPESAVPHFAKLNLSLEDVPVAIKEMVLKAPMNGGSLDSKLGTFEEDCWGEDEVSYTLSIPTENVVLVDTIEHFKKAMDELSKATLIGIDGEWKPTFGISMEEQVALIQLATPTHVYLLDIVTLHPLISDLYWILLGNLFTNSNITKVGYGIRSDLKAFAKLHPEIKKALAAPKNIIDLDQKKTALLQAKPEIFSYTSSTYKGLSDCVYRCFGKPLNKGAQFSNWADRPLSLSQLMYAALDAECLIDVYNYLNEKSQELGIADWQNVKNETPKVKEKQKRNIQSSYNHQNPVLMKREGPIAAKDFHVVCDTMLQGLAKKLRLCGIDAVALENGQDSQECIKYHEKERRFVLTSGIAFARLRKYIHPEYICHVESKGARGQLTEVMKRFNIVLLPGDVLSRCVKCNVSSFVNAEPSVITELQKLDKSVEKEECWLKCVGGRINLSSGCIDNGIEIKFGRIAPSTIENMDVFYICRNCGQCYWDGEHEDKSFIDFVSQFIVHDDVSKIKSVGHYCETSKSDSTKNLGKNIDYEGSNQTDLYSNLESDLSYLDLSISSED